MGSRCCQRPSLDSNEDNLIGLETAAEEKKIARYLENTLARSRRGDPGAVALAGGNFAIKGHRILQYAERAAFRSSV